MSAEESKLPSEVLERVRKFPAEYNRTAGKPLRVFFEEAALIGYLAGRETSQSEDFLTCCSFPGCIDGRKDGVPHGPCRSGRCACEGRRNATNCHDFMPQRTEQALPSVSDALVERFCLNYDEMVTKHMKDADLLCADCVKRSLGAALNG